jgi:exosortase
MAQDASQPVAPHTPSRLIEAVNGLAALLRPPRSYALIAPVVLASVLLWAYWPTLTAIVERWNDPKYSHGYLVPAFALYLLWFRRRVRPVQPLAPSNWGLALVLAGLALNFAGSYLYHGWLSMLSLLPVLAGICLFLGGWAALLWAWPSIAFLVFMMPLPYRLEVSFAHPLQRMATLGSAYVLQTLGFPALAEGNVIKVDQAQFQIVEACNGLSMLVTFCALSTAVAVVIKRPWLDRIVILASAPPIAVFVNVVRIVIAAVLNETAGPVWSYDFFHNKAGWVMMVIALGVLWLELYLLARLFVESPSRREGPLDLGLAIGSADRVSDRSEQSAMSEQAQSRRRRRAGERPRNGALVKQGMEIVPEE